MQELEKRKGGIFSGDIMKIKHPETHNADQAANVKSYSNKLQKRNGHRHKNGICVALDAENQTSVPREGKPGAACGRVLPELFFFVFFLPTWLGGLRCGCASFWHFGVCMVLVRV